MAKVIIEWGEAGDESSQKTYTFGSVAELNAFMMGLAEMDALSVGYGVVYDSREDPKLKAEAIKIVCRHCESEDVVRDAFAEWSITEQDWVLSSVYDSANCNSETCDGNETKLEERPVQ